MFLQIIIYNMTGVPRLATVCFSVSNNTALGFFNHRQFFAKNSKLEVEATYT